MSAKRMLDVTLAGMALIVVAPLLALLAIGIRLAGPGPIFYRAQRVGRDRRPFTMYKLRTMRIGDAATTVITAHGDPRIFPLGRLLRHLKLDELPQLVNILRGEMSIVGPRPEDPSMVKRFYAPFYYKSFDVPPGLTSPGSIYAYTHGEAQLDLRDAERSYGEQLLPIKMALDLVYVARAGVGYDIALICRTVWTLGTALLGRRSFPLPPELPEAQRILRREGDTRMMA